MSPERPCCPRCGDQTLWRIGRSNGYTVVTPFPVGALYGYCRLCHHTWDIDEDNPYREKDQEEATK